MITRTTLNPKNDYNEYFERIRSILGGCWESSSHIQFNNTEVFQLSTIAVSWDETVYHLYYHLITEGYDDL